MPPIKNQKGQFYPWAIPGKNFAAYESVWKFYAFLSGFSNETGKTVEMMERDGEWIDKVLANGTNYQECKDGQYVGGSVDGDLGVISVGQGHQGYRRFITPEQEADWQNRYEKDLEISKEFCEMLRTQYVGKTDEKSMHLHQRSCEMADWIQMQAENANPQAGNIAEAEMHAPYLFFLSTANAASPLFTSYGLEKCVNVLEQNGVAGGKNIYDDYMTMMSSAAREVKVQYERQKMENTGWDAEKEARYLNMLRLEHQKTVEAYDRLWEIDDEQQYDSVLNNPLDHLVGKESGNTRDMNYAVGFLRGEMRAIDLGYDSRHLNILGQFAAQEQDLKKKIHSVERDLSRLKKNAEKEEGAEKDPEKKKAIHDQYLKWIDTAQEKQTRYSAYQKELDELKKKIWDKRVNSVAEMEENQKLVDDFFETHREKNEDLNFLRDGALNSLEYGKQLAKDAPVIKQTKPTMHLKDLKALGVAVNTCLTQEFLTQEVYEKYGDVAQGAETDDNEMLLPQSDLKVKAFAGEIAEIIDKKIAGLDAQEKQYPHATTFQKALLIGNRQQLDNMRRGMPVNVDSPLVDRSLSRLLSFQAQLDPGAFSPENIAKTEKAIKEIGIDEFAKQAIHLQELHQNYELNKDTMSLTERRRAYQELNDAKRNMIKTGQDINKKLENPSEEVRYLLVNDGQLQNIRGVRGLGGLEEEYFHDIMKLDIPQADKMKNASVKFNTARAAIFRKESDEHKNMREAAELVGKDMEQMQKGTVMDQQTGQERPMTQAEKESFLKSAWEHVKTLDEMSDRYIEHATENGTKTPRTSAGKDRLAGATEMKALTVQLKEHLGEQPELRKIAAKERRKELHAAKYGKSVAEQLADMDREVEKFRGMSQNQHQDSTAESRGYQLNEFEYQVARVIAIATVVQEFEKGKLDADSLKAQVTNGTKKVAGNEGFQKWVKTISNNPEQMKKLGTMSCDEVKTEFVNGMSKKMEKKEEQKKAESQIEEKNAGNQKKEKNNNKMEQKIETKDDKEINRKIQERSRLTP